MFLSFQAQSRPGVDGAGRRGAPPRAGRGSLALLPGPGQLRRRRVARGGGQRRGVPGAERGPRHTERHVVSAVRGLGAGGLFGAVNVGDVDVMSLRCRAVSVSASIAEDYWLLAGWWMAASHQKYLTHGSFVFVCHWHKRPFSALHFTIDILCRPALSQRH